MGRPRPELAPGLRSFVVHPYVIFFRPAEDTIEVIRVLRGSRDIAAIMKKDGGTDPNIFPVLPARSANRSCS